MSLAIDRNISPVFYSETTLVVRDAKSALSWLQKARSVNKKNVSRVRIFVPNTYHLNSGGSMLLWRQLFNNLTSDDLGLKKVYVYWDGSPAYRRVGGGFDVHLVRALAQIRGLEKLQIDGFFAKEWPGYLEKQLGMEVWKSDSLPTWELKELEKFQALLPDLQPWDGEEGRRVWSQN